MVRLGLMAIVAAAFAALLLEPARSGAGGEGFVVVVNQANALDRYGRADVSRLFLKRTAAWPNGVPAAPWDLSGTSPTRKAFSERVHGKPVWVIVAFWQQEIASGRSRPPAVCPSEAAALQAVRDNPGGVAYVAEGAALGPGLKVLALAP
jgi:ABC-type phosphate transport system substrate-binding protein